MTVRDREVGLTFAAFTASLLLYVVARLALHPSLPWQYLLWAGLVAFPAALFARAWFTREK